MRIRNLTYELKRPIPLALAGVAAIAVLIAVVIGWQQAEERHLELGDEPLNLNGIVDHAAARPIGGPPS